MESEIHATGQRSPSLTEDEKADLKRLREEIHRLKMERDILKTTTIFLRRKIKKVCLFRRKRPVL
tara:strand:- start:16283 stop:16477 length:195 start_codon:yes stop_codon:yes gene_type:complete